MIGTIIFISIFYLLFISFFIYIAVSIGPESERQKEVLERGESITCRVVKLKYRRYHRFFFIKTGDSDVKVEFMWKGEFKRLEATGSVPNDVYKVGDSIELMYFEKYPKTIIIPGTEPLSHKQIFITRIILVILAIAFAIWAVAGIREELRQEESRRRFRGFMESRMASEEYAVDELVKAFNGNREEIE